MMIRSDWREIDGVAATAASPVARPAVALPNLLLGGILLLISP